MRYIDTSSLVIPENWLEVAKLQLGNTHSSLWTFLKPQFQSLVQKKCWFSESINNGSDNVIEHFRPKAENILAFTKSNAELEDSIWGQIDCAPRIGYKYLEYIPSNYRYACTFVNSLRAGSDGKSRGKQNFFPLQINSAKGFSIESVSNEISCILDPCNKFDPEFLTFNELGEIQPNVSILKNSWDYCRVKVSIEIYHLHYYQFREARLIIWDQCKTNIELAHQLQTTLSTKGEIVSFKFHISEIFKKIDIKAEHSAVAVDCVKYYIDKDEEYSWLRKFFNDELLKK